MVADTGSQRTTLESGSEVVPDRDTIENDFDKTKIMCFMGGVVDNQADVFTVLYLRLITTRFFTQLYEKMESN